MKVLDTSAWIEYFKGTEKGAKVKCILAEEVVGTSVLTLAEMAKWCVETKSDWDKVIIQIKANSNLIPVEELILIEGGKLYPQLRKIKTKIGLIDVLIYVSTIFHEAELVTSDTDYAGLASVLML